MDACQGGMRANASRYVLEMAADAVETADVGMERLVTLLTAEVGATPSEVVYGENKLELHRYEPETVEHGTPIFVVYALVNRPYILDLQPDRSVVRRLLEAGFEVYLVDWGEPSRLDSSLGLADYVCRYVDNCVDAICEESGVDDVHLLGYCMGGTLSVMYTALFEERVRTLGLMATPVVLDDTGGILERWARHYDPAVTAETFGNLPAELLALEFALMDPVENTLGKYVTLLENIDDEEFLATFARMEQWIWDGVDVAGEAFREFVTEVYLRNNLIEGGVTLGGDRVDVAAIDVPLLQVVGTHDHIVPPESSKPLNERVASEDERIVEFDAGHIGVSVSSRAHDELWPEVRAWYAERSQPDGETVGDGDANSEGPPENGHRELESVRGIGPTYAGRLAAAGIDAPAQLREYEPELLAAIADTSPGRAEGWLDAVGSQ